MRLARSSLVLGLCLAASAALAEEGMWTFNDFPAARVKERYGFEPSAAWLDHLRLSSVRIAGGCSASIVSPEGLVMTNHHCARQCIQSVSGLQRKDFNHDGFFARTLADEPRCPGYELNQLTSITDVTARIQEATRGVPDKGFNEAQKRAIAAIEKECASSDDVRCDVVTLYRGGRYDLYAYRRFQDIRLVFAPEDSVAFFGGDPDNFTFPRYDLDVSFLRIYGPDHQPLRPEHHLAWATAPVREGELTFVSGHPGGTSRSLTLAQLEDERDHRLPTTLLRLAELRGLLTEYQTRGREQRRHSNAMLFGAENGLKANWGRHQALGDPAFLGQLARNEAELRAKVKARPELEQQCGGAWDAIAALVDKQQAYRKEFNALERFEGSTLADLARRLLRHGDESAKPNGERLAEYADARLPQLKQAVLSNRPIFDELEVELLAFQLTKLREQLGADHPVVRKVLGSRTPAEVAAAAVKGSHLKDLKTDALGNAVGGLRKELFDGGREKIAAAKDPMIELLRSFDDEARAVRKKMETEVDGPLKRQQQLLARARLAVYGQSVAPDATFTLRLSYGTVKGYLEGGQAFSPITLLGGAFARHTGAEPFALPPTWLAAKGKLRLDTPFNVATTNDIIGGNSGSPLVNQAGQVVGLIFDGNLESLAGDYGYDEAVNRAVAVTTPALLEALDVIYGARRLVTELQPAGAPQSGQP
jgi:Peptidase S46